MITNTTKIYGPDSDTGTTHRNRKSFGRFFSVYAPSNKLAGCTFFFKRQLDCGIVLFPATGDNVRCAFMYVFQRCTSRAHAISESFGSRNGTKRSKLNLSEAKYRVHVAASSGKMCVRVAFLCRILGSRSCHHLKPRRFDRRDRIARRGPGAKFQVYEATET